MSSETILSRKITVQCIIIKDWGVVENEQFNVKHGPGIHSSLYVTIARCLLNANATVSGCLLNANATQPLLMTLHIIE